ncbi:MAG: PDZ domain-containing protein [Chthoniobacterales bacterium]|nr:PDZ domain-containing protein [Chthoniobacterales bacterium]
MNPLRTAVIAPLLAALVLSFAPGTQAMEVLREKFAAGTTPSATPESAVSPSPAPGATPEEPAPPPAPAVAKRPPVVRVNVTQQSYSFSQPWRKNQASQRQGLGVVLPDGRILVTAGLVADHTYIELEEPETARKEKAELAAVDYETNLALLSAPAAGFLQNIPGATLDESAGVGSRVDLVQLEANGAPVNTPATLTTVEVGPYVLEDSAFLLFRLSVPLQSRENSFTLPVFKDGALVGLVMRYDPRTQAADLVPAPVIARFLQVASKQPYAGFPRAGLTFSDTRDPQLRRYARLNNGTGGAYITKVQSGSPAEAAGLKVGDILLRVGDKTIDQDGNYEDARFGKVSLAHYVSTLLESGQKVPLAVWRDGAETNLEITLAPRDREAMISQPYTFDQPPKFVIVGGIVFTELSRQFLREWGQSWTRDAPLRLLYLDRFQSELRADRGKIVFISGVLSGPNTVGYEDLAYEIVDQVNGRPVRSLEDLAAAVDNPPDKFHRIKLAEDPGLIILDVEASKAEEKRIRDQYRIPKLRQLGTESSNN